MQSIMLKEALSEEEIANLFSILKGEVSDE